MGDFRSDTVTRPTPAMREAMAAAEVGDDVFGEDPTVVRLEREGAALLGVEAALFVPSGTMANQIAMHLHCSPGDEVICESRSHVAEFEAGGLARWSGATLRRLDAESGFPAPVEIESAIRADDDHLTRSRVLLIENSHNMAGGRVLDPAGVAERVELARRHGLRVHVDGARLLNAAVALGCAAAELTRGVDSVSLCLSKGIGAPVGSLLGGSGAWVREARRARKAFGGGMRQVGVLAAPARWALAAAEAQLAEDHVRAARLADGLDGLPGLRVAVPPETNMVMVDVPGGAGALVDFLGERSVYALAVRDDRIRFVTHRDVQDDDVDRCIAAARAWSSAAPPSDPPES